ncbi:MAG: hypothetical protein Q7S58_01645 [Candidatus Binatus sp.]|uniref:hypothetical protein n=1 Tax=Candidatus Binatus sp. TaxID=2811406 RepID=UPI00271D34EF|nr:hypothetical protein [Candidatus Binatus sp.]MDO8431093.1 hypothetical protein [Candidatus Binatus sp.]
MNKEGLSVEAIAESVEATPDEVKPWLEEYNQRELKREAKRFGDTRCAVCGAPLLFNREWAEERRQLLSSGMLGQDNVRLLK